MLILVRKWLSPDSENGAGDPAGDPKEKDVKPSEDASTVAKLTKALQEQRENSVSKAEFEKMKAERDAVVAQVIDGENSPAGGNSPEENKVDIASLKNELYGPKSQNLNNLEYIKKTLQLRDAIIERDGEEFDPFLPLGANIKPTEDDVEKAKKVAEVFQQCVDESDGDSGVFTAKLQALTNNDSAAFTNRLKKLGIKFNN